MGRQEGGVLQKKCEAGGGEGTLKRARIGLNQISKMAKELMIIITQHGETVRIEGANHKPPVHLSKPPESPGAPWVLDRLVEKNTHCSFEKLGCERMGTWDAGGDREYVER